MEWKDRGIALLVVALLGGGGIAAGFIYSIPMTVQWWAGLAGSWIVVYALIWWSDTASERQVPSRIYSTCAALCFAYLAALLVATIASIAELLQIMETWDEDTREAIAIGGAVLLGPVLVAALLLLLGAAGTVIAVALAARSIRAIATRTVRRQRAAR